MKVIYGFSGIIITLFTSTYPGVFLGPGWVWAIHVISTVDVGERQSALVFNPNNDNIYVANALSDDVSVIQTTTSS